MPPIVVVGASLAGLSAVDAVRSGGHDGDVVVLEAAAALPSDRPPLSKQVLAGTMEPAAAHQPLAGRLDELAVDLRLGVRVDRVDVAGLRLELSDGSSLSASGLVVATGASPRTLPGPPLAGVHVVRTLDDSLALRRDLDAGPDRVAVIGAGFIGAEVAATCRGLGLEVTLIEAAPAPMVRVLPEAVGAFVADLHRAHGVDVRLGVGVEGLVADGDRVRGVALADGTTVDASVVVVGIGVAPDVAWLEGSGVPVGNGVTCDETCLAAPGVVAAGDVAEWFNPHFGERMRVEQWEHAIEHGAAAGRRLLAGDGPGEPFGSVPWFWSDQYDRKLQLAGRPAATDEVHVLEGSLEEQRFVAAFRRGERCTGVLGVNRPRHVVQARMRLTESLDWAPIEELLS
ncbi:MAG: NAD(P)/FAD-dependent oxidoreductase [Acidobacteria bacterium]|nr:NAD(P)/FAD-dependent oxidoreductase [Acidobacteriota bacterium]